MTNFSQEALLGEEGEDKERDKGISERKNPMN
jgi:hypothetical protein